MRGGFGGFGGVWVEGTLARPRLGLDSPGFFFPWAFVCGFNPNLVFFLFKRRLSEPLPLRGHTAVWLAFVVGMEYSGGVMLCSVSLFPVF